MEGLWGRLPEELLGSVLLKLPLASLVRFRRVCKKWARTLWSAEFLRQWTARGGCCSSSFPIFLYDIPPGLPRRKMPRLRDSALFQICKLDLSFLQVRVSDLWTSNNGLLCFHTHRGPKEPDRISLCVCNPVTRTWKSLPPILKQSCHTTRIAMAVDATPAAAAGFKVVVLCTNALVHDDTGRLCVYSSQHRAWKMTRPTGRVPPIYRTALVVCGALIYLYHLGEVLNLYALDGEVTLVRSLTLRVPPGVHREYHRLLEHNGRVLLVGRLLQQPSSSSSSPLTSALSWLSFGIWRLQLHDDDYAAAAATVAHDDADDDKINNRFNNPPSRPSARWRQLSVLPQHQWNDMVKDWKVDKDKVELLHAVSIGDCIFLSIGVCHFPLADDDEAEGKEGDVANVLVYHTLTNAWTVSHGIRRYPHGLLEPRWDLFI